MPVFNPIHRSLLIGLTLVYQTYSHAQVPQVPVGGNVVGGNASYGQINAQHQVINQLTPKAIIDWQNFSIGAGSSVRINQPNSSSILLNRVVGNTPSTILGNLTSNGQVFIVNPFGVYFGAGSSVDVMGLVATTLNIRNDDFMAGKYVFSRDASTQTREVINAGLIKARENGYVVLAGDYTANNGIVQAKLGTAVLASGSKMTVDIQGDNLVNFSVDEKTLAQLSGVENSGQILVDGGKAIMTAAVARDLATAAVNNSGLIQAQSAEEHEGTIYLSGTSGNTLVSGKLDVSGKASGQKGGTVTVLGDRVALTDNASVDAAGDAGGGTVQIGGNFQGKGPLTNSSTAYIGKDVQINADAIGNGNGGKVVVWSDQLTRYYGNISAKGGAQGGNGGDVEVSGKAVLNFNGTVNTLAPKGAAGNLLLDPSDIEILTSVNPATADMTAASPFADLTDNGGTSQMTVGTLETALANGNVTITTTTGSGTAPKGGTITIDDGSGGGIDWSTNSMLRLKADNTISILSNITGGNGTVWLDAANGASQKAGTVITANGLALTGSGSWDLAGVGSTSTINSYNNINTFAANINGGLLRLSNNKSFSIGSVNGVNGITHTNGNTQLYLDRNNGALQIAQNVNSSAVYIRAGGGTTQTGGTIQAGSLALNGGAVSLNQAGNQIGTIAANINGDFSITNAGALAVGNPFNVTGISTNNHNVSITTGDAAGYDKTKLPDGTNPASLTLNQVVNAGNANITLSTGSGGVYQRRDIDSATNTPKPEGSLTAGSLLLKGNNANSVVPFVLNNANNQVGTLAASTNGSISYTGSALTVGSAGGVNGITTTANTIVTPAGTDSSGRPTPAIYNDNNVSLSIGGNINIAQNINAVTTTGSGSVTIGMGGDYTASTAAGKRINANTLSVVGNDLQGTFLLTSNVSALAAAGGKLMVIDNTAYTGDLTGLGIGSSAASATATNGSSSVDISSTDKPVGDFYLTTGGALNIIKLNSKGNNLLLRANSLNILLDATTANNARIMLQPYDLTNRVGVNNASESTFAPETDYSSDLLLKFNNPTATFYVGTPQNVILNDATVASAAKNTLTGDIHIGADGAFNLGYRSLSAQTSSSLVAYNVGPLYNLRLAAPNLTINSFNTFGDQIHFFTNNLSLPNSADNYVNPNKPNITLRSLDDNTIWVGNGLSNKPYEPHFLSTAIQKLPGGSTVIISGTTDFAFPSGGAGNGDIHITWDDGTGDRLGDKKLILSTGKTVYTYGSSPTFTKQNNSGTSGGLWTGCKDLTTCAGTNPSPYPLPTGDTDGGTSDNPGTGGTGNTNNSGNNGCQGCPPAPPNTNPYPPTTGPNNGNPGTGNNDGNDPTTGNPGDGSPGNGTPGNGDGDNGGPGNDGPGDGGLGDGDGGTGDGNNGNPGNPGNPAPGDNGLGDGGLGNEDGGDGGADSNGPSDGGLGDGGLGNSDASNGGTGNGGPGDGGLGDGGLGNGDGGDGGAGNGGVGDGGLGDGGLGNGDTGNGGAGNGGAGDGGVGDGGLGNGDAGNGGAGNGGAGDGGLGDGGLGNGDGGNGGTGNGGAGDGGLGDGGLGNGDAGDGGAGNGGAGAGGLGDGGLGNGDAGDGGAGNGGAGVGGLGDGGLGNGDAGDGDAGNGGTGAGGLGNGGLGNGDAGDGGAGNGGPGAGGLGDGGQGNGDGGDGGADTGGAGNGGAGAGGLGDGGPGNGNANNGTGNEGSANGDGGASTAGGGNGDGAAGLGNGGIEDGKVGGGGDAGSDANGDVQAGADSGGKSDSGSVNNSADAPAPTSISCGDLSEAQKEEDPTASNRADKKGLIEIKRSGVKVQDPCQKQTGQDKGK